MRRCPQALATLLCLHEKGITHGDVTALNVVCGPVNDEGVSVGVNDPRIRRFKATLVDYGASQVCEVIRPAVRRLCALLANRNKVAKFTLRVSPVMSQGRELLLL